MFKRLFLDNNTAGRDFIAGPIYSRFDLIMKELKLLNFNFDKDRLFSVGGLNYGSDVVNNLKTIELLNAKWFYCALGKEEYYLLEYFGIINDVLDRGYLNKKIYLSKNSWIKKMDPPTINKLLESLNIMENLPVFIKVQSSNEFYILSGERVFSEFSKEHIIKDNELDKTINLSASNVIDRKLINCLIFGDMVAKQANKKYIGNLSGERFSPPIIDNVSLTYSSGKNLKALLLYKSHMFINKKPKFSNFDDEIIIVKNDFRSIFAIREEVERKFFLNFIKD